MIFLSSEKWHFLAFFDFFRPDVYILDDILPHLEPEFSQHILENTIIQQLQGRTVILLTSRIGDLKHADFSYIMEEGCIVEEGAYEIIKYSQVYNRYLDTYTVKNDKIDQKISEKCKKNFEKN